MYDKKKHQSDSREKPPYNSDQSREDRSDSGKWYDRERRQPSRSARKHKDSDERGSYSRRSDSDERGSYSRRSDSDERGSYSHRSDSDERGSYSRRPARYGSDGDGDRGGYSRRPRNYGRDGEGDRGGYSRRSDTDDSRSYRQGSGYKKSSDHTARAKPSGPIKAKKAPPKIELNSEEITSVRLEGRLSVTAALKSGRREIQRLFVDRAMDERRKFDLKDVAWRAGAKVEWRKRQEMDDLAKSTTHGGVLALVGPRQDETLEQVNIPETCRFVVMLDGVEDPYSYGQAIRAFYAAGIDLLIRSPRDWGRADATIVRASGGCSELVKTVVADVDSAATWARNNGFQIITTSKESQSQSLFDVEFGEKVLLLIGGEKRGVTRSFLSAADAVIGIPYGRDLNVSLGTVAASSILAFEVMRRGRGGADEEVFELPGADTQVQEAAAETSAEGTTDSEAAAKTSAEGSTDSDPTLKTSAEGSTTDSSVDDQESSAT